MSGVATLKQATKTTWGRHNAKYDVRTILIDMVDNARRRHLAEIAMCTTASVNTQRLPQLASELAARDSAWPAWRRT